MKVLVTRPAEDGAEIARKLAQMGHETLLAPLLTLEIFAGPPLSLDGVQAVLVTSANGVRALAQRTGARDVPLFAVGPQTEAAARDAGFVRIRSADGDAATLATRVREWADPANGPLFHAAAEEASGALAETLRGAGFQVRRESLYRVIPAQEVPPDAASALARGTVDAALFFSPRSAEIFAACARRAGLDTRTILAVCISQNTATALGGMEFREIRVAPAPNQDSLLASL